MPITPVDGISAKMIFGKNRNPKMIALVKAHDDLLIIDDKYVGSTYGKAKQRYERTRYDHCKDFIKSWKGLETFIDIDKLEKWKRKAKDRDIIEYAEILGWCYTCCEALLDLGDGYDDQYKPYKRVRKYADKYAGRMENWMETEYEKILDEWYED